MQTDGWLSEQSAKVYEVSTETLFLGRQDAMQRQTLVPLAKWMSGRPASGRGVRALEVAAGTGRFATFIKVVNISWLAISHGVASTDRDGRGHAGSADAIVGLALARCSRAREEVGEQHMDVHRG